MQKRRTEKTWSFEPYGTVKEKLTKRGGAMTKRMKGGGNIRSAIARETVRTRIVYAANAGWGGTGGNFGRAHVGKTSKGDDQETFTREDLLCRCTLPLFMRYATVATTSSSFSVHWLMLWTRSKSVTCSCVFFILSTSTIAKDIRAITVPKIALVTNFL